MTDLNHGSVAYQGSVGEVEPIDLETLRRAQWKAADYVARNGGCRHDLCELLDMLGIGGRQ